MFRPNGSRPCARRSTPPTATLHFIAEGEKLGIDISPVTADAIVRALDDMAHASPAVLDYMKKLMAGAKGG